MRKVTFKEMGSRGFILGFITSAILGILLFIVYVEVLDEPVGDTGVGDVTRVVPAAGATGYPVDVFCEDPLTKVYLEQPLPEYRSYTLSRLKDGVNESVIWNPGPSNDNSAATHYLGVGPQQVQQPAAVTEQARKCIERKAESR